MHMHQFVNMCFWLVHARPPRTLSLSRFLMCTHVRTFLLIVCSIVLYFSRSLLLSLSCSFVCAHALSASTQDRAFDIQTPRLSCHTNTISPHAPAYSTASTHAHTHTPTKMTAGAAGVREKSTHRTNAGACCGAGSYLGHDSFFTRNCLGTQYDIIWVCVCMHLHVCQYSRRIFSDVNA